MERRKCFLHNYRHVLWFLCTASWISYVQQIGKSLETLASLCACGHSDYTLGLDLCARPNIATGSTLAVFQGHCCFDSRHGECQRQRCAHRYCRCKEIQSVQSAQSSQECHGLANKLGRYLDTQLFEEVSDFESGPSFRIFVWGPMLLQLLKLLVVRGSLIPRSLRVIFFVSWLINDLHLIVASLDPLSSKERSQAAFIVDDCNPQALQLIPG